MLIKKLDLENIMELKDLYSVFEKGAVVDFLFEVKPLNFNDFLYNFKKGFIKGYFCDEGFILYTDSLNESIEITIVFTHDKNDFLSQKFLLSCFVQEIKKEYANKIISYPMLGIQNVFVQEVMNFGFKTVGEAVLEFDFYNVASQVILRKCKVQQIQYPYHIDFWNDSYLNDAIDIVYKEFKNANDAKFDPRFKSKNGVKVILESIVNGYFGDFNPNYVSVLKFEDAPVGVCFVNFTTEKIANIPIFVIDKQHQNKGFASALPYC